MKYRLDTAYWFRPQRAFAEAEPQQPRYHANKVRRPRGVAEVIPAELRRAYLLSKVERKQPGRSPQISQITQIRKAQ